MVAYIYHIRNSVNGKGYVGFTSANLKQRWRQHKWNAKQDDNSHCVILCNAIRKYGAESFTITEVSRYDTDMEALANEDFWIEKLNTRYPNGYNIAKGGDIPPMLGKTQSEAAKKAVSEANRLFTDDEEKKIVAEYLTNESSNKLGAKYKCSGGTILNIVKRYGARVRTRSEATSGKNGAWFGKVGTMKGRPHPAKGKKWSKPMSDEARKKISDSKWLFSKEEETKIVQEYIDGQSAKKLADKYKCTTGTIGEILKRHNTPRRSLKEAKRLSNLSKVSKEMR
jgi:group I intron endonuclease